jgi:hypothetical protein
VSNNLIESSAADLEWFGWFVLDKAKISRKISERRSAPSAGTLIILQKRNASVDAMRVSNEAVRMVKIHCAVRAFHSA